MENWPSSQKEICAHKIFKFLFGVYIKFKDCFVDEIFDKHSIKIQLNAGNILNFSFVFENIFFEQDCNVLSDWRSKNSKILT